LFLALSLNPSGFVFIKAQSYCIQYCSSYPGQLLEELAHSCQSYRVRVRDQFHFPLHSVTNLSFLSCIKVPFSCV
jgi:hypothetical protein